MKMNFKFLALAAAALTFAACTDELVQTPEQVRNNSPESNAISFSTYMGRTGMTRAGETGALTTAKLQASTNGFGVFAYYTPVSSGKYEYWRTLGDVDTKTQSGNAYTAATVANFMYNQQVKYSGTDDALVTKWEYSPLKYWPNEISATANTADDDQDNDQSNNQATGSGTYGGNVSFFAYAPYVALPIGESSTPGKANEGIIAINGTTALTGTDLGNAKVGDPIITYVVPAKGNEMVDLLWGTAGTNGPGVTVNTNKGQKTGFGTLTSSTFADVSKYPLNINLTKQKTTGTIDFAFKHALAKVGGSQNNDETTGTNATNGLMVILDLDDLKGAETGGIYTTDGKDGTAQTTKVTIVDVKIDARSIVEKDNTNDNTYNPTYLKKAQGDLNLATGEWAVTRTISSNNDNISTTDKPDDSGVGKTTHIIVSPESTQAANKSGDLADEIAEPSGKYNKDGFKGETNWNSLPVGVTTTKKNVYQDEAAPLVFIPGTYPELTITVDYIVRTLDKNLSKEFTEVRQVITKRVTFNDFVELNKQYSLLMHLGLTSVKFTAQVSNWEIDGDKDGDGTITEEEVAIAEEEVYLPRNVGGIAYNFTSYSDANKSTTWGTGVAVVTGYTKSKDNKTYSEVIVLSNSYNGFTIDNPYYIEGTTVPSGAVQLYDKNLEAISDVFVEVSKVQQAYTFSSYSEETGGTNYSDGAAKFTGNFKNFNGKNYTEIVVLCNDADNSFAGKTYYVEAGAKSDGSKRYQLYDASGTAQGLWVEINTFVSKTYNFTSHSAAENGTQYSTGTAKTTGNFTVFGGVSYIEIEVVTNPQETSWVGKKFFVPKSTTAGGSTRVQLRNEDGTIVNGIWVAIGAEANS